MGKNMEKPWFPVVPHIFPWFPVNGNIKTMIFHEKPMGKSPLLTNVFAQRLIRGTWTTFDRNGHLGIEKLRDPGIWEHAKPLSREIWVLWVLHGFIWIYMDLYGFIWIYMDLYGFTWIYMDFMNSKQSGVVPQNGGCWICWVMLILFWKKRFWIMDEMGDSGVQLLFIFKQTHIHINKLLVLIIRFCDLPLIGHHKLTTSWVWPRLRRLCQNLPAFQIVAPCNQHLQVREPMAEILVKRLGILPQWILSL